MTDINKLIEIIKGLGGSAELTEITSIFSKLHHVIILPEHSILIDSVLSKNTERVHFNDETKKWVINNTDYHIQGTSHIPFNIKDIYSSVKSIEKEFPNIIITNVTNAGKVENCAYFKDKRILGEKSDRILHIWPSHDQLKYYVQKRLCTEKENDEAAGNPDTNGKTNQFFRDSSVEQFIFIRAKLNRYFELEP